MANVVLSSQLSSLIQQFAPDRIQDTINQSSPFLDSGALKQVDAEGREFVIYAQVGGHESTQWIADNGSLPDGYSTQPQRGSVLPANVISTLAIGRAAASMSMGTQEAISLFDSELNRVAGDMARHIGRGLFGGTASPASSGTWTSTSGFVEASFLDVSMFKPGVAYEYRQAASSNTYLVKCTNVTPFAVSPNSANVAGKVVFSAASVTAGGSAGTAIGSTTLGTSDVFTLRGVSGLAQGGATSGASEVDMISYDDIVGSGSLHGISAAGWVGNDLNLGGAYSQEAILSFGQRVYTLSNKSYSHVIMSPALAAVHAAAAGAAVAPFGLSSAASGRIMLGAQMDKFGAGLGGLQMGGKPVIQDPNCPATQVILHNQDAVKLVWFKRPGPDQEAGESMLLGRSKFSIEAQMSASLNLVCSQRNAIGRVSGITGL